MAIDTAAKRASALSFAAITLLIPPDGAIGQPDRQTVLHLYSGIAAETPAVETDIASYKIALKAGTFTATLKAGSMTITVGQ